MFVKGKTIEPATGDREEMKSSRSVVTKTVERTGGVRTTTTTFNCCSRDDVDAALSKLDLDPLKFRSGGTTVTKTVVYTDSSGHREVLEETVEDYGDPDKVVARTSGRQSKDKDSARRDHHPISKDCQRDCTTKDPPRMGTCCGKKDRSADVGGAKNDSLKSSPRVERDTSATAKFEQECLKAHNEYRAKHRVPPLQLSKEMCAYAQEWADTLAATDSFRHRSGGDKRFGENIYMKWSSDPGYVLSGKEPVESWYSEIKDHVFRREPTSLKSGHFTQVVWKTSKTLGVGQAKSKSGKILVVANYDPAGNFVGRFADNVPPPA